MLRALWRTVRGVLRRGAMNREMREEMELHLARAAERYAARGMSPRDAALAARREFGNVAVLQEEGRDARAGRWIDDTLADARFAIRHFGRRRALSLCVVLVLALGLGATSALVTMVQATTMRPAPGMPDDARLVRVREIERADAGGRRVMAGSSPGEVDALAAARGLFASVAGWADDQVSLDLRDGADPTVLYAQFATPNLFSTLGIAPRGPLADESVIVSDDLWERAFGRDPRAIGRMVSVNGIALRVAGVAPPRFHGATPQDVEPSLWIPLSSRQAIVRADSVELAVVARLRPGVAAASAAAVARTVVANAPHARHVAERTADVVPLRGETDLESRERIGQTIVAFVTVTLLVLLVTCSNVSSLLLGAAVTRRQEIAVRLSLGASRLRIVRQLLTESAMLAVAGALLGTMLYWWAARLLASSVARLDMAPDAATAAVTSAIGLAVGLVFGLSPALHATRAGTATALRDSAGTVAARARLQRAFVVAQMVFSQPLLVVLAMMIAVTLPKRAVVADDPHLLAAQFATWGSADLAARRGARVEDVARALAARTGIDGVVHEAAGFENVTVNPKVPERVHVEGAMPGWFAIQRVPLERGRDVAWSDTSASDVPVVVGSDLARRMWDGVDPIGQRFARAGAPAAEPPYVVVGVFDATHPTTRGAETRIYTARGQHWRTDVLLVRTRGPARNAIADVRRVALAMPELPLLSVQTLADVAKSTRDDERQIGWGAAAAGSLALLLASIGLFGVVSLAVGQRTREIGIRIAVGAAPMAVARSFFRSGVLLSMVALAIGMPVSLLAVRSTVRLVDAPAIGTAATAAIVSFAVLVVAAVATWLPARRAARVDPALTLKD